MKNSGSGLEIRDERPWGSVVVTTLHFSIPEGTNVAGRDCRPVVLVRLRTESHIMGLLVCLFGGLSFYRQ
jgi:hypothetical protein